MVKNELIREIANKIEGATQKDAAIFLEVFQEVVKEGVAKDGKVAINGFITFEKKHVPARTGKLRKDGEEFEWTSEDHDKIIAKLSDSYKAL